MKAARCMWQTADVRAERAKGCTGKQRQVMARCEACGDDDETGFRSWHLVARCLHPKVVEVRRRVTKAARR